MAWLAPTFTGGITWEDFPNETTPLNASDLNTQENAEATYAAAVGQSVVNYFESGGSPAVVLISAPNTFTREQKVNVPSGTSLSPLTLQNDNSNLVQFSNIANSPGTGNRAASMNLFGTGSSAANKSAWQVGIDQAAAIPNRDFYIGRTNSDGTTRDVIYGRYIGALPAQPQLAFFPAGSAYISTAGVQIAGQGAAAGDGPILDLTPTYGHTSETLRLVGLDDVTTHAIDANPTWSISRIPSNPQAYGRQSYGLGGANAPDLWTGRHPNGEFSVFRSNVGATTLLSLRNTHAITVGDTVQMLASSGGTTIYTLTATVDNAVTVASHASFQVLTGGALATALQLGGAANNAVAITAISSGAAALSVDSSSLGGTTIAVFKNNGTNVLKVLSSGQLQNSNAANETATATTGASGAPPAQVQGYLLFTDSGGTQRKIPYYNV